MFFDEENIFEQIGREFLERLEQVKEENQAFGAFATGEEELSAYDFLDTLLDNFAGSSLEDTFDGYFEHNSYGRFYVITAEAECDFQIVPLQWTKQKLRQDLKLVRGIRHVREQELKAQGFKKVDDLLSHPLYSEAAAQVLDLINTASPQQLIDFLSWRFGSFSAPAVTYCTGLFSAEDFLFFDLETMGLFHRPIILFGMAFFRDGRLIIRQFLVDSLDGEAAALYAFLQLMEQKKALVSFNGRAFDWNYIKERAAYYGLAQPRQLPHFDLYHSAKRFWPGLSGYRLQELEKTFWQLHRKDDVPGDMVPLFYETYLKQGNIGPLVPVVEHNKQDLISLARLFVKMQKEMADDR